MFPKIVFMGSPDFAVPALKALSTRYDLVGVVTQPDQPAGRGRTLTPPPIKVFAQSINLPVIQPVNLKDENTIKQLVDWEPDVLIVVAFGQILRKNVLDLPPLGCINVHASLLPRWRGAAPVQAAILAGDPVTGVTIMKLDKGVDTGPILTKKIEPILPDDSNQSLGFRLSNIGAELLMDTLPLIVEGKILPIAQDETLSTYAPMIKKEHGELDFNQSIGFLERQVRAYYPWPGTYMKFKENNLKILKAHLLHDENSKIGERGVIDGYPVVGARGGWLILDMVQPAGKKALSGDRFLIGAREW
jgi:methionyl-tRNA formyltransferase